MKAIELIKKESINYLLAVGGGSVIDGTKFIAAAIPFMEANPGVDPWEILSKRGKVNSALPLACVLTLPATGTESNGNAVVSRGQDKLAFGSPNVYPRFAVLDPKTTLSLDQRQISNGIVDAYAHTLEQYLTYPVGAKIQDRYAESILLTLIEEGPKALANPEDMPVRANIMWAATQALNGLIGVGVPNDWTTHMIGHELTALHGVDHGASLSIIFPAVMQVRSEQKKEKLLQYGERVFGISSGSDEERIKETIEASKKFFRSVAAPVSFTDAGLDKNAIPKIMENLAKHGAENLSERGDLGPEDLEKILHAAL